MGHAVFDFPLKEKLRNYLRVEQLLGQLKIAAKSEHTHLQLVFFEQLSYLITLKDWIFAPILPKTSKPMKRTWFLV